MEQNNNEKTIYSNVMPEFHFFPKIEKTIDAIKHLIFRYPDEPFASHGDHFQEENHESPTLS